MPKRKKRPPWKPPKGPGDPEMPKQPEMPRPDPNWEKRQGPDPWKWLKLLRRS